MTLPASDGTPPTHLPDRSRVDPCITAPRRDLRAGFGRHTRPAAWLLLRLLALSLVVFPWPDLRAEKADRNKPINVEADRLQYDDLKQINVFTGNVTLTKGTIVIKADRMIIKQDAEGFQFSTAYGNPATFRQKREGLDQYIEGFGLQLDYDGKTEVVKFQQKAILRRLEKERVSDEVHGNLIVYESLSEFFTVESGGANSATPANPSGRVKVIIQPKNAGQALPGTTPQPTELKPADSLTAPRGGTTR